MVLADLGEVLPVVGLAVLAVAGIYFLFRKKPQDPYALERQRRAYLNRIGRIVEGHILEVVDRAHPPAPPKPPAKQSSLLSKRPGAAANGTQKLLYYSYSISGVTYETAQDVTGLEEQAHLKRVSVGQSASVKYDPSNPSNSILLADDWSGIR